MKCKKKLNSELKTLITPVSDMKSAYIQGVHCRFTKMNGNVDRNLSPGFTDLLYQPGSWTLFRHAIVRPLVLADLLEGKVLTISRVNSCMFSVLLLSADLQLDLKIAVWLANYTLAKQHHKYDDYLP